MRHVHAQEFIPTARSHWQAVEWENGTIRSAPEVPQGEQISSGLGPCTEATSPRQMCQLLLGGWHFAHVATGSLVQ